MIDGPRTEGAAWGCTACGGVWAGVGASERVASILDPAVRELADAADRCASTAPRRRELLQVRPCPDCGKGLDFRELAGVTVDVCREHGTWFDRGELQRIAEQRLGKPETDPKSARWKPDRVTDLAADVAIGALRLFLSILDGGR